MQIYQSLLQSELNLNHSCHAFSHLYRLPLLYFISTKYSLQQLHTDVIVLLFQFTYKTASFKRRYVNSVSPAQFLARESTEKGFAFCPNSLLRQMAAVGFTWGRDQNKENFTEKLLLWLSFEGHENLLGKIGEWACWEEKAVFVNATRHETAWCVQETTRSLIKVEQRLQKQE